MSHFEELSSDERERAKRVATMWNAIDSSSDTGSATREALERLQQEVSDCLYLQPIDPFKAERLTSKALMLISGCELF